MPSVVITNKAASRSTGFWTLSVSFTRPWPRNLSTRRRTTSRFMILSESKGTLLADRDIVIVEELGPLGTLIANEKSDQQSESRSKGVARENSATPVAAAPRRFLNRSPVPSPRPTPSPTRQHPHPFLDRPPVPKPRRILSATGQGPPARRLPRCGTFRFRSATNGRS